MPSYPDQAPVVTSLDNHRFFLTNKTPGGDEGQIDGDKLPLGGVVSMGAASGTPATNLATLHSKLSEAKVKKLPLYLEPGENYTIDDDFIVGGSNVTILFGEGAQITQTAADKNGITFDEVLPPHYLKILGGRISGVGHATSTGSAIYGRRGDGTYLCGDIQIIDTEGIGFSDGINLRNVVKVYVRSVNMLNCVTGIKLDKWDTFIIDDVRITGSTAGGAIPNSRCFHFNEQSFGGVVRMGEFGGANIARFCEISGIGCEAIFVGCNLEQFDSAQVCTMEDASGNTFDFRYGRCTPRVGSASTDAFLSINASGNDQPRIGIVALSDWSPSSKRLVEVYGSTIDPAIIGEPVLVRHTSSRGGTETRKRMVYPGRKGYFVGYGGLPNSSVVEGQSFHWESPGTSSDEWLRAPLHKLRDNRSGTLKRFTSINEQHSQVIGTSNSASAGSGTVTLLTAALVQRMLSSNGESVHISIGGATAANANAKQFLVKLNGNTLFDSGALALNDKKWWLDFHCQADSGYEKWVCKLHTNDSAIGTVIDLGDTSPVYGNSSGVALNFTVEAVSVASGDITHRCGKGTWLRAVPGINS